MLPELTPESDMTAEATTAGTPGGPVEPACRSRAGAEAGGAFVSARLSDGRAGGSGWDPPRLPAVRETVTDPDTAEKLVPRYLFATRRTCVDTGYYQIFNREGVELVDVSTDPIAEFTETGIRLASGVEHPLDTIILATGYDAMTGAFLAVEVTGREGLTNAQAWAEGPVNLLGLMVAGFPNLFTVTGPGSPSVLTNVIRSIEHHVDWLTRCFEDLRAQGIGVIEATPEAQADWVAHNNAISAGTLFTRTPSWYCGADIPGKPKVFMPYAGGLPAYRQKADGMAANGYAGFALTKAGVRA